jgi:Galactose oxidase, central domain/Kelch motif
MHVARTGTATLLTSGTLAGRVLLVGGSSLVTCTNAAEVYDPVTGTYSVVGSMARARYYHTATLLPDGRVLVVGGTPDGLSENIAEAEIFDPETSRFSSTGKLAVGRYLHTATLLNDGRVLVVGGVARGGTTTSAEIFNPGTGLWSSVGNLQVERNAHTATLLGNGTVLVAGGKDLYSKSTSSAEIFNPTTLSFTATGSLSYARSYHTASIVDGKVFMMGGLGPNGELIGSLESFYGSGFNRVSQLNVPRYAHTATVTPNGDILVTGGGAAGADGTASVELCKPYTGCNIITSMNEGRIYHTATMLANGDVLVAGGVRFVSPAASLKSSELYDPLFLSPASGSLPQKMSRHTGALITMGTDLGKVLLAGGESANSVSTATSQTWLFDPTSNTLTSGPSMVEARFDHTATTLSDGKILIFGGTSNNYTPLGTAELFFPASERIKCSGRPPFVRCIRLYQVASFQATASAPITPRRAHTATYIPSIGKVLVTGGSASAGGSTQLAELYDPSTDSFSPAGAMNYDRRNHTATLVIIGGQEKILITGGWSNSVANTTGGYGAITHSIEVYDPLTQTFTMPSQWGTSTSSTWLTTNRHLHQATLLANGKVLFTGGLTSGNNPTNAAEVFDPATMRFTRVGNMSVPRMYHTANVTAVGTGKVLIVGGYTTYSGGSTNSVELFDPATSTFTTTASRLRQERANFTATTMTDGRILVVGGSWPNTLELSKIMQ